MEGERFRVRGETWGLDIHTASQRGLNEAQATATSGSWDRSSAAAAAQQGLRECGAQRSNTKGNAIKR